MHSHARFLLSIASLSVARSFQIISPIAGGPHAGAAVTFSRDVPTTGTSLRLPSTLALTSNHGLAPSINGRMTTLSVSDSSDGDGDVDGGDDLIESRTNRIAAEYRASASLCLGSAMFLSGAPFFGTPPAAAWAASGPIMASAVSLILRGAAEHRRLGSDTYKRLNLSLAYFGVCGAASVASRLAVQLHPRVLFFMLPYLLAIKPGLKGWFYGVRGVDKGGEASLVDDLFDGAKSSLKGIVSVGNRNAAGYLAGTLFVGALKVAKLIDLVNVVRAGENALAIGAQLFHYAKLPLLTCIMYTLKDAADRNRLEGTTFVQLNFLASLVLGILFAHSIEGGEITKVAGASVSFSAFCAYNGARSILKKRQNS